MSIISSTICRAFVLWLHLGIGPMIGAGPMQARPGRPKSGRARGVDNPRSRSASRKVLRARAAGERADAA